MAKGVRSLDYPRKVLTIEPLIDFDPDEFAQPIIQLDPEYVWIGFDSHSKDVIYPEPPMPKVKALIEALKKAGAKVKLKNMAVHSFLARVKGTCL
jgi:hypothetical protein